MVKALFVLSLGLQVYLKEVFLLDSVGYLSVNCLDLAWWTCPLRSWSMTSTHLSTNTFGLVDFSSPVLDLACRWTCPLWYFLCFGFVIEVGLYTWGLQTKFQHYCNYIDECIMAFIWPLHGQRNESWWRKFQKLTCSDGSQGTFFKNLWIWDHLWVQFFPFLAKK